MVRLGPQDRVAVTAYGRRFHRPGPWVEEASGLGTIACVRWREGAVVPLLKARADGATPCGRCWPGVAWIQEVGQ